MTPEERAEAIIDLLMEFEVAEGRQFFKNFVMDQIGQAEQVVIKECAKIAQEFHAFKCDYTKCNLKCLPNRIAQKIREQVKGGE